MSRRPGSIRTFLTLWFAGTVAGILLVFALGTYALVRLNLDHRLDERLADQAAGLVNIIQGSRRSSSIKRDIDDVEESRILPLFQIHQDGEEFFTSRDWRHVGLDEALGPASADSSWVWTSGEGRRFRVHALTDIHNRTRSSYTVTVAEDVEAAMGTLRSLEAFMVGGLIVGLLLALGGGYFLAGRVLKPVDEMAGAAEAITARNLSDRLPVRNPEDEFGRLATVFNEVLERLEGSFQQLRRFNTDVSHALRTPLTALRSTGEVRLQERGGVEEHRETIGSMLEEADRLRGLVSNLLALARAESGEMVQKTEELDLSTLASEVTGSLAVLAEEKDQVLETESLAEGPLQVRVDRDGLRHALINLVDNAIRHTPEGTRIAVRTSRDRRGHAVIEVADDGPGIPAADQERVFERFHRVETDQHQHPGAGLGLAITRWLVSLNGGHVEMESVPGEGSTFRIVLP
ncbi:MAG: ATP-binding protein [bacterium]